MKKIADLHLDAGEKIKLITLTLDELIDIPTKKNIYFAEQEITLKLMEAKLDPEKRKELEELFKP